MQPMFRHTPPNLSISTQATFMPSWAARIAATYPPGPLPITIRSKVPSPGLAGNDGRVPVINYLEVSSRHTKGRDGSQDLV